MRRTSVAFTLIELLVVVTIIVVLLSLLTPALDKAIDAAIKAKCAAQQHTLGGVSTNYAMDHRRKYIPGTRGHRTGDGLAPGGNPVPGGAIDDYDEHIPYLSKPYVEVIARYSGNNNSANTRSGGAGYIYGGQPPILIDPSYSTEFGLNDAYGSWMGYNYLGGHPYVSRANGRPDYPQYPDFESPMSLSRTGTGEMWVCHNTWEVGGRLANIAHTEVGGPAGDNEGFNWNMGAPGPKGLGSAGGNVGRFDGSSIWKDLETMSTYASGANRDGTPYTGWPAMW